MPASPATMPASPATMPASPATRFSFTVKQGDALHSGGDLTVPVAHFIAKDAAMGAGIALTICREYGNNIRAACRGHPIGSIIPYHVRGKKPVLNMISKDVSYLKPTLANALATLGNLKKYLKENKITKLHIPFIGAGLDGLSWFAIEEYIIENFSDIQLDITAFYFSDTELQKIIAKGWDLERAKFYMDIFGGGDPDAVLEHVVEHAAGSSP